MKRLIFCRAMLAGSLIGLVCLSTPPRSLAHGGGHRGGGGGHGGGGHVRGGFGGGHVRGGFGEGHVGGGGHGQQSRLRSGFTPQTQKSGWTQQSQHLGHGAQGTGYGGFGHAQAGMGHANNPANMTRPVPNAVGGFQHSSAATNFRQPQANTIQQHPGDGFVQYPVGGFAHHPGRGSVQNPGRVIANRVPVSGGPGVMSVRSNANLVQNRVATSGPRANTAHGLVTSPPPNRLPTANAFANHTKNTAGAANEEIKNQLNVNGLGPAIGKPRTFDALALSGGPGHWISQVTNSSPVQTLTQGTQQFINGGQQGLQNLGNGATNVANSIGTTLSGGSANFVGGSGSAVGKGLPVNPVQVLGSTQPGKLGKLPSAAQVLGKTNPGNVATHTLNTGKQILGQGASNLQKGTNTLGNMVGQSWSRGPGMADPTPMGWNIKPFPHATLANGLTFEVNGQTYHVPFKGQGKVWGIEYELGMRNVTLGDIALDALLFECMNPAIEEGMYEFFTSADPEEDTAFKIMPFLAWAASQGAEEFVSWMLGIAHYETFTPPGLSP
jgi:hypothetical protein